MPRGNRKRQRTRTATSEDEVTSMADGANTSPAASRASSPAPTQSAPPLCRRKKFDQRYKVQGKSDDVVLDAQKATWTSSAYEHFHPPTIERVGEVVRYIFRCKSHPSIAVSRARHDESTSNLKRHVDQCTPSASGGSRAITAYAHGSAYNAATHRMNLALWIARRHRPFAIVGDPELLEIFQDLNNKCVTPSAFTVSRDIKEIFQLTRGKVAQLLQAYPGKLHLGVDGWTAPQAISFLGITVHWISGASITSIILDFVKASKAHTGTYLAARIVECLHEYGIQKNVLGIVCDNASNNDTMIDQLGLLLPGFKGRPARVRCFAHILNLVVKAILSQFSKSNKASKDVDEENADHDRFDDLDDNTGLGDEEIEDAEPADETDPSVEHSDRIALDRVASDIELDDRLPPMTRDDVNLGRFSVFKLRNLAKKIVHSPTVRGDLNRCCIRSQVTPVLMIRDVATRWNSTTELIGRALQLREPLKLLVIMQEYNKPRGVRLQRFQLSDQEWALLKQLFSLLDVFLLATKKISHSRIPLIHEVIPIFDALTTALDEFLDNEELLPAVRAAALRGITMMNKYYALTDDSVVYRVAMILHPRYKTNYFTKAGWLPEWIRAAQALAQAEWQAYKPANQSPGATTTPDVSSSSSRFFDSLNDKSIVVDALEEWMSSAPVKTNVDPIAWWSAMDATGHPLARMALNFLSVPATSTDVERAFSRGGLTVSKMRHSLSDESTRAATVLSSWCTFPELVPRSEIVSVFKEKSSRMGSKAKGKGRDISITDTSNSPIDVDMDSNKSST